MTDGGVRFVGSSGVRVFGLDCPLYECGVCDMVLQL